MAGEQPPSGEIEVPPELPVLALQDLVVFPMMVSPLVIDGEDEAQLIDAAATGPRVLALIQNRPDVEPGDQFDPAQHFEWGTVAFIMRMIRMPDGSRRLLVRGHARMRITEFTQVTPFPMARVQLHEDIVAADDELPALAKSLLNTFQTIVNLSPQLPAELYVQALNIDNASVLADMVASHLNLEAQQRQAVLEAVDVKLRLRLVAEMANKERAVLELADKVQSEARGEMEKVQRDYFLRQQLRSIRKELGEDEEGTQELEELEQRLAEKPLPEAAREAGDRELNRLKRMSPAAAEYTVARTYLDWILELPWQEGSEEHIDVREAQQVLDEDHFGLEKVKERIVEYLSVRSLNPGMKGPILCFVGPPGVGKTSLGRSIARALGRRFHRISLGGVRDEAEIRGHRRTYVGALPGRIIQGIRTAAANNPVFMLDEVDKLGADFRGDPAASLLEVLDPEQNNSFVDHYLDVPFDLSAVMFICTGNVLVTIPPALLDRMEVLPLPGYTEEEKLQIDRRYLVPRQREAHGLRKGQLRLSDAALARVIREYTREAGVRNLEREIGTLCRKTARQVAEGVARPPAVTPQRLHDYLGPRRFYSEAALRSQRPGIIMGLAYTETGGEVLFIEATRMAGSKQLTLTGHLGNVMQESAQTALSWVRANAKALGIAPDFFEKSDLHVHVPSGAIPKDGPSAGVAMATALTSLLSGRRPKPGVAMTGEITLRGHVMPIGGVKEKVLAARRAGVKTVILPKRNATDLEDLRPEVKAEIAFVLVNNVNEVLEAALEPPKG